MSQPEQRRYFIRAAHRTPFEYNFISRNPFRRIHIFQFQFDDYYIFLVSILLVYVHMIAVKDIFEQCPLPPLGLKVIVRVFDLQMVTFTSDIIFICTFLITYAFDMILCHVSIYLSFVARHKWIIYVSEHYAADFIKILYFY